MNEGLLPSTSLQSRYKYALWSQICCLLSLASNGTKTKKATFSLSKRIDQVKKVRPD